MKLKLFLLSLILILLHTNTYTLSSLPQSAFGEILAVQPTSIAHLLFTYNINTDYVSTSTAGTATLTHNTTFAVLTTGTTASSSATLTSIARLPYSPGQGSLTFFTAIFPDGGVANTTQIIGAGTDNNGFFFGYNGTSFGILHRNANATTTDTWIPQASWNHDTMDGNGPSGMTLDTAKGNVFKIQFQYLGFGSIKFFIEDPSQGTFVLVHDIQYANSNTVMSLSNPTVQLYAKTTCSSAIGSAATLKTGSMSCFIEGFFNRLGNTRNSRNNTQTVTTTNTNVLTIRNDSTFQSQTNEIVVFPDCLSLYNSTSGSGSAIFNFYLNPTISGTQSFTNVNTNTSVVSYDTSTVTITGGKSVGTIFLLNGDFFVLDIFPYGTQLNPGDQFVCACATSSGSLDVTACLSWTENF